MEYKCSKVQVPHISIRVNVLSYFVPLLLLKLDRNLSDVTDTVIMSACFITVENHSRNTEVMTSQLQ